MICKGKWNKHLCTLVMILGASAVQSAKYKKRMAGAIDTIELSPDVRNHRGVERKKRSGKKAEKKPAKKAEKPVKDAPIVPAQDLESETAEEAVASATPARDALKQAEGEENRRRRAAVQVSTDQTLRVAPVDERPEFVAQGKVDDSRTRIFGKLPISRRDYYALNRFLYDLPFFSYYGLMNT